MAERRFPVQWHVHYVVPGRGTRVTHYSYEHTARKAIETIRHDRPTWEVTGWRHHDEWLPLPEPEE